MKKISLAAHKPDGEKTRSHGPEDAATTGDFRRWLDGEPEPTWETRRRWLDSLTQWAQEGRPRRRVRLIHDPITDYERYACDWGYVHNTTAGEQIRILDLSEHELPPELEHAPGDWSVIDDRDVIAMLYHPDGQFQAAQLLDVQHNTPYRDAARTLWALSEPFTSWWDHHPQHHRSAGRAA